MDITTRFNRIFDAKTDALRMELVGCGSIGSNLALLLARLGVTNLKVYDDDKVEDHNLGHQAFRVEDIGKHKVDCMKDIIKASTGFNVDAVSEKTDGSDIDTDILILGVDSMKARKEIAENAKYLFVVDGRMGGETFNVFATAEKDRYLETLYDDAKASDLPCGGKSIGYISYLIAGVMENTIKKICRGEKVPFEQNFCALNNIYQVTF